MNPTAALPRLAPRLAVLGGLAAVLFGAGYLWFARGAAILLDSSWVGCL
ncbi:MAG: hypothetical protein HY057_10695 [Rhodospirillales bacterium]|nr:hypothetical protein [Rhodospirillales bacterium]